MTVRVTGVSAAGEKILTEAKELSFIAGDGEVCDVLEGTVIYMKVGEEALVRCESSEACVGGLLNLPAGLETPIMIQLSVLRFDKALEKWDLDSTGRLARARSRRAIAAELFKKGRTRLSAQHYESAAELFSQLDFFPTEDRSEAAELRRICWLNQAMCVLRMGNMKSVITLCDKVLTEDPTNPKARFRRAKARLEQKEYEGAVEDLNRLLEVEPNSTDGQKLLREAKRLWKKSDERQASTFAKMCGGFGSMPERTDRRDDDIVAMPDIEAEYAKIAQRHGIAFPPKATPESQSAPAQLPPETSGNNADASEMACTGETADVEMTGAEAVAASAGDAC